ncbi:MAG: long-chain fatty acid--CoA ligase [Bacteriovoracaceae bacterium]|nr:long-chain fatty acid--CoA ligase [Bacteriovoracaceae bacterium]
MKENSLGRLLLKRVQLSADHNAIGWIESHEVKSLSFKAYKIQIEQLALALQKHGLVVGDRVAILAQTSKEWHFLDMAVMCSRGVVVPIYPSYLGHEIKYIFNHSESKILVIENDSQFEKLASLLGEMPQLRLIVALNELNEENKKKFRNHITYITFKDLLREGQEELKTHPDQFEEGIKQQKPEEVASIVYTSGTTGEPKGAVITHSGFTAMLDNVNSFIKGAFGPNDRTLTFLPLSHVLGRCDSLLPLIFGWETVYAEGLDKITDNLQLVKPTLMMAVPRIFEKIYAKINDQVSHSPLWKQQAFKLAVQAGEIYFSKIDSDRSPGAGELLAYKAAQKVVFAQIYQKFGGKIRYFVSGGAPLSPDIIRFLRYANLTVLEGYGLTETIAPCALNPLIRQVPGTVGKPMGDVEFRFAEDGEILIKTQAMFKEYYQNPEATKEAFTEDGWFRSGDIGHFTVDGYLQITDRKKDLIITSGGKNVAPQKIENMLKSQKWISHAVVIGDKRKFLTAIIGIEKERFQGQLESMGLSPDCSLEELAGHPKVHELIQSDIDAVNQDLAQYETIKRFNVSSHEFSTANFLTPSLKIKRKLVTQHYVKEIEAMYQ